MLCRERASNESAGAGVSRSEGGTYLALAWVADVVAEGRVTADAAVIMRLLQWLALGPWRAGLLPPFQQRQQHFIALLHHLDLRPTASNAGTCNYRSRMTAQGCHATCSLNYRDLLIAGNQLRSKGLLACC